MTEAMAPPYPADTRAKGWRFELDYEKIDQSDTWSLAADVQLARPCLLMMWLAAWTQEPCGSLPNDEAVIRARCQIPVGTWPKVRDILMRGWRLASDGRLYHDTLTKRVEEMIEYRRKNAKRVADFKAAQREQRAGNALPTSDHVDNNDTGTGTGTITSPSVKRRRNAAAPEPERPEDVSEETWRDWTALRRGKSAKVSDTALRGAREEAAKAGLTLERFLAVWVLRGSQGLSADWLKEHERGGASNLTFKERDAANAIARVHEMTGGLVSAKPYTPRRDALDEVFDVTPIAIGR